MLAVVGETAAQSADTKYRQLTSPALDTATVPTTEAPGKRAGDANIAFPAI